MKQYYTIGEISKIYQIGTDSLRYYEKLGILSPRRGANGYRIYGLDDLWKLNVIRDLRRLDFPILQMVPEKSEPALLQLPPAHREPLCSG